MVRGVAVALVMLRHAWPARIGGAGIIGVELFFVLSGYLITGLLVAEFEKYGRFRLRRFYVNRLLRLYPPLLALLAIYTLVELTTNRLEDRPILGRSVLIGLSYTADVPFHFPISLALSHLWTLAIEEQFYLFWPLILLFALRRHRLLPVLLLSAAAALAVEWLTFAVRMHAIHTLYTLPTSWCIALVAGAIAQTQSRRLAQLGLQSRPAAVIGAIVLVAACVPQLRVHAATYVVGVPVIALCSVTVVMQMSTRATLPSWTRPLCMLGTVSYAVYLWNYPMINWFAGPSAVGIPSLPEAAGATVATVLAAMLSWYALERPIATIRRRRERDAGAAAIVARAALGDDQSEALARA